MASETDATAPPRSSFVAPQAPLLVLTPPHPTSAAVHVCAWNLNLLRFRRTGIRGSAAGGCCARGASPPSQSSSSTRATSQTQSLSLCGHRTNHCVGFRSLLVDFLILLLLNRLRSCFSKFSLSIPVDGEPRLSNHGISCERLVSKLQVINIRHFLFPFCNTVTLAIAGH